MKKKNPYLRFLWMLPPSLSGLACLAFPGCGFSGILLLGAGLIAGIFCILSLIPGPVPVVIRNMLIALLVIVGVLGTVTEVKIVRGSRQEPLDSPWVIVLGAGVNGTEPSLMLQNRIDRAYAFLTEHPRTSAVLSGGKGDDESISEAECMYRELTRMGIDPNRLLKEEKSTSTAENIRFSLDLLETHTGERPEAAGLISNEFHLYRAKRIARDQGLTASGIPARTSWLYLRVNYYVREVAALWYYMIFGG